MASRPTAGESAFTFNEPFIEKNAATLAGFWLHHAAEYFFPKSVSCSLSIVLSFFVSVFKASVFDLSD